jgi:hypothetical protein
LRFASRREKSARVAGFPSEEQELKKLGKREKTVKNARA